MKAVEATMGMARRVMSRSVMSMVRTILGCGDNDDSPIKLHLSGIPLRYGICSHAFNSNHPVRLVLVDLP
jgi:hypothetical protein